MTFQFLLRAELRKLRRPLVLVAVVSAAFFTVAAAQAGQHARYSNLRDVVASSSMTCPPEMSPADCDSMEAGGSVAASGTAASRRQFALQTHPLGVGFHVGGHFATAVGWMLLLTIAAAHIAGEWPGGTAGNALVHAPRSLFLWAKFASTLLAGVLGIGLSLAVAAIVIPAFRMSGIADGVIVTAGDALQLSVRSLAACLAVMAGAVALLLLFSLVTKSPLGTVGLGILVLAFGLIFGDVVPLSPASMVRDVMPLEPSSGGNIYAYLWRDVYPGAVELRPRTAALAWLTIAAVSTIASHELFARQDVPASS